MYRLEDLRRIGWTQLYGGMATLVAGILAQYAIGFQLDRVIVNNFIYYVLFAMGWFLFNQIVMAGIYKKLLPEQKRAKLSRLTAPVTTPPIGRFKMLYWQTELFYVALWIISVVVVQFLLGTNLTMPIGGFAGGWLVGGGLGRLRFAGKVKVEEVEQGVRFYFSDSVLGPSTAVAFYSDKPEDRPVAAAPEELAVAAKESLPPGVKRRAVPGSPANRSSK
ncbi:MAG: hypothetical protein JWP00_2276 [Chloroflexi bacterium]|nr:hypothetical protein [Chloroflexota bacterium]